MLRRFADRVSFARPLVLGVLVLLGQGQAMAHDGPRDLGPHIRRVLTVLLNQGATMFNDGDPEGCCRVYESTLLVLRPVLVDRPQLLNDLDLTLAEARKKADVRDRAFALRAIIDSVRSDVAAGDQARPKPDAKLTLTRQEQAILDLTNVERTRAGVPVLVPSEKLFRAARAHSENMARQERLAHTLDGEGPAERLRKAGYRIAALGENCAVGQRTPAEAISSWMNSEGHRRNLLSRQYTEIGIGIAVSAEGMPYYTQVFATLQGD